MRTHSIAFLLFATACSTPNPANDAGSSDAGFDVPVTDVTTDAPDSADGGSCSIASATVNGTMLGQTLNPKDAISYELHTTQYEAVIAITDFANACSLGNDYKASSNVLSMVYLSNTTPLATGTYNLAQSNVWDAQYAQFDATCNSPQGESSTGGTITITSVDSCGVVGSYDLMLNTDHVTGTFDAVNCTNPADGGAGGCKP